MKKYNPLIIISTVLALLLCFVAVYAFSVSEYIPAANGGVPSYPVSNTALTVIKICAPVLSLASAALAVFSFVKARANAGCLCAVLEEKRHRFSPVYAYLFGAALITSACLIYVSVHRNTVWDHYIFRAGGDMFMDFFNHITYVRNPSDVYSVSAHACFPPFIYIFYYLLSLILPMDATVKHDASLTSPYAIVTYVIYTAVCCIFLYIVISKLLRSLGEKTSLFTILAVIASSVFITVVERGNSVLIVLILLIAALYLRDSDKKLHRELALICIAAAAGIKIYPAVFGLLYIAEKRWKEAVRLIIYGALFFFVPFIFFGGFEGLSLFISNQMAIHDDAYTSFTSISSSVRYISLMIFDDPFILDIAAKTLPWVFTVLAVAAFFFGRLNMWEKVMLLVTVIAFVPAWSGSYTAVFFAIPMLLMFRDHRGGFGKGFERIYLALCVIGFTLAFSLIVFVTPTGGVLYEIRYLAMHAVALLVLIKALVNRTRRI